MLRRHNAVSPDLELMLLWTCDDSANLRYWRGCQADTFDITVFIDTGDAGSS